MVLSKNSNVGLHSEQVMRSEETLSWPSSVTELQVCWKRAVVEKIPESYSLHLKLLLKVCSGGICHAEHVLCTKREKLITETSIMLPWYSLRASIFLTQQKSLKQRSSWFLLCSSEAVFSYFWCVEWCVCVCVKRCICVYRGCVHVASSIMVWLSSFPKQNARHKYLLPTISLWHDYKNTPFRPSSMPVIFQGNYFLYKSEKNHLSQREGNLKSFTAN